MNKVFLIGRLTRDPELRYTGSNIPVATFTIAVNRNYTSQNGEREADFIPVVVWRKQAENVKNYTNQGSLVAIDGRIQVRNYDDKDGVKRYVTEVIADNIQFLDTKASREKNNSNPSPYDMPAYIDNAAGVEDIIIKNNTTTSTADAIITIANENQSNAEAIKSIIDRFN